MRATKYGNFLTVLLVILITAILIGIGFLVYNVIKKENEENRIIKATEEFDRNVGEIEPEEEENEEPITDNSIIAPPTETPTNPQSTTKKKTYYEGFVMIGYITIPKTNVKQPILDVVTQTSLDTAVVALYPSNPQLNTPGNVVIIGHNYRDGRFFSNNKKLEIGDKVKIKDTTGTELTYTIYQKFETTPEDTSFYTRNTNGAIEVTLSSCTDDNKARTIILARVEE